MRRALTACCLLLLPPLPGNAGVGSLGALDFAQRDFSQCRAMPAADGMERSFRLAQLAPQHQYCLVAQFNLTQRPTQPQVLRLSVQASTEVLLDGVLVGSNGTPATTAAAERAGLIDYWLTLTPQQLDPGRHTLVLKMSTWHASTQMHTLFHELSLQDQSSLRSGTLANLPALLLAGALALAALLFAGLFAFYHQDARWLVFLLLCVTACMLLLVEAWRGVANYAYSWHLLRLWSVTVLSAVFALLLPSYYLLVGSMRQRWPLIGTLALALLVVILAVPWFDGRATLMFIVALLASACINLLAWRRRREGALASLVVSVLSIGVFVLPGVDFARTGFALVVCLLMSTIFVQLLRRFVRERDRAVLATRLENQLLRKSLQPHFLMNALSLIGELMHQSPVRAERYIESLGREFRMLGEYAQRTTITLHEELALCRNYLEIMSTRYQRDFKLEVRTSTATADLLLPPAVLLTSLENAFSHNRYRDAVVFTLHVDRQPGHWRLLLATPQVQLRVHEGSGTGLDYIRLSLTEAFGASGTYTAEHRDGAWLSTFTLPCVF